jgi:hypothetical protein
MISDAKLKRLYRWVNVTFYEGELPDDVEVWWEACQDASAKAVALDSLRGEHPQLGIKFDPCLSLLWRYAKLCMIHECAHIKLWPIRGLTDHGKRFDEEIQRLCSFKTYRKLL